MHASINLLEQYAALPPTERSIISTLAIHSEALGKTKLYDILKRAGIRKDIYGETYSPSHFSDTLARLTERGFIIRPIEYSGLACVNTVLESAIHAAIQDKTFDILCDAIEANYTVYISANGTPNVNNCTQGIVRLRLALLRGKPPETVHPWLNACAHWSVFKESHPYIKVIGEPFIPALFDLLHPDIQKEAMSVLLKNALYAHDTAPTLLAWCEHYLTKHAGADHDPLVPVIAEYWLLCGRLSEAWELIKNNQGPLAAFLRSTIRLLRGEPTATLVPEFETAIKAARKTSGKRNILISGISGYFYVLALLRDENPKTHKMAGDYLELMMRTADHFDLSIYHLLLELYRIQNATVKAEAILCQKQYSNMLAPVFVGLINHWLGLPPSQDQLLQLKEACEKATIAGFHFIAAQAASLLNKLQQPHYEEQAAALCEQYGFSDLANYFARQEPWERQLSALMGLQRGASSAASAAAPIRLIWLIDYHPTRPNSAYGTLSVEPREQKRNANGSWTKGRAIALKRLCDGGEQLDSVTLPDLRVIPAIKHSPYYYGHSYEINGDQAALALIDHPLVFWQDMPTARVEIVRSEVELLVQESDGQFKLTLQPNINLDNLDGNVLIAKETPTRLRVTSLTEEHRHIASIIGQELRVPAHAKESVLQALGAISSTLRVHSDIEGSADHIEKIEVDKRLRVHLLPHQHGLKMQILVRPFGNEGPYYTPGQGAARIIADIQGKPLQTRRDLAAESAAQEKLILDCPALRETACVHGEWFFEEAESSLELLLQLQTQAQGDHESGDNKLVIAWPEGEKFKVGPQIGSSQFSLSIKRDHNWFAANGQLQIDNTRVLELRKLLELIKQSQGRFINLGNNEFVALTDEFKKRLHDLALFSDPHDKGVRVHSLATFALEEFSNDASLDTDTHWKQHLRRLSELDALPASPLPSTLQAELRDYQRAGFQWLSRLAHWGVGACLADDMGLGKTLQALALILERAPQGPTLIVAPTSVCLNWVSEAARFAPTLNVIVFGVGDREKTLSELKPFDMLVVSYGLLQQEAGLFAEKVHWNTVVLDEAQAIKNSQTKRSQAVMALTSNFRIIATGTPLENHLGELWNLFRFINPGLLGSLEQFNQRFALPIERLHDASARASLRRLIQPFILRRTKAQVLTELPSRTEIVREVVLSQEEMIFYEALRQTAADSLANLNAPPGQKHLQILAEIMKLRRACCHPQLVSPQISLGSSKLAAFGELLDELLENHHKALVFSQFVDHLSFIRAYLDQRGVHYQYLDGSTPMQERKKRVDAFQAGQGDIFLISLKAGGMGINLTAADYVIHMDPWWNPAVEDQASDRAHRLGQQRPVTIYRLVAKHTIEETIVTLHKHKRDLADSLLEGSDVAGRMSAKEMMALLQTELRIS